MIASVSKPSPNTSLAKLRERRMAPCRAERGDVPTHAKAARRRPQPRLEPPDETREVRALRTVERVQLVHNQEPERIRRIVPPTARESRARMSRKSSIL